MYFHRNLFYIRFLVMEQHFYSEAWNRSRSILGRRLGRSVGTYCVHQHSPNLGKNKYTNTQYTNTKILKFIQLHKYRLIRWYVPPTLLISGQNNNCDSILENGNFQQGRLIIVLATTWGVSFVYHIRDCPNRWYKCITVECGLTACLCLSTTCSFSFLL